MLKRIALVTLHLLLIGFTGGLWLLVLIVWFLTKKK